MSHDLRYAIRMLTKTPGFTLVAVLTLALGIGATAAIFTVVNAVLLRPLPYADPDRLVMVWQDYRARGGPADEWATPGNYADWRRETALFERLAVLSGWRPTLTDAGEPEPIPGEQVSHEYFDVLGVTPVIGRSFLQEDDVPNAARVVMIGEGTWKRRFGGDPAAIGRTMILGGEPHVVIGVVPERFRAIIVSDAQLWRPLRLNTATPSRGMVFLRVVARLAEGLDPDRAQIAANALGRRLEQAHPDSNEKTGIALTPLHDRVVGEIRPGLLALLGGVGFVLLIACANIANLLLARGSGRGREVAVRVALGAGRGRVVRQLLTESLLLAILGGAAGLLLSIWVVDALVALGPADAPRLGEVRFDVRVFGFVALLTLGTGVVFGLAPALQASRGDVTQSLRDGARGTPGHPGRRLRGALIAAEVALALVLLTGGGLLLQTFARLQKADLGFRPQNLLVGFVNPPRTTYDTPEKHRVFYDQVLERVSALPGVERAALASVLPLGGDSDVDIRFEGRPPPRSPAENTVTWYRQVSADYFETMGIPLRRGRGFEEREAAPSVVVNETFVRTFFPGEDPIGRRMRFGSDDGPPWFTIVGIAADVKVRGAREGPRIETYVPYWQYTEPGMAIILRAAGNPAPLAAPMRQAVYSIDRNVAVSNVGTLSRIVADSIDQPRFVAMLASAFAGMALLLAAIGLYGVMAYSVTQRTSEIGVRMALGATPRQVFRLILGDGLRLTVIGVAAGLAGSLVVARWLSALLFDVAPGDPMTLTATTIVLLAVALLASVVPARRATRVDPITALRTE